MGHRVLGRYALIGTACAMGALSASCGSAAPLPGTSLGTYNVSGALGTNTCGGGIGAPNPYDFSVHLSEDGATLYWEQSGGSPLSSAMTSSTQVSLTSVETANVDPTDAGMEGPCDLTSTTTIALSLASGAPPRTFSGTITYTFAASTGVSNTTDCTDQLTASGGTYDTLPCTATYTIAGLHR
jgi:hypothetical protein